MPPTERDVPAQRRGLRALMLVLTAGGLAVYVAAGCATLNPLADGCGNGVLEANEDCDGNFKGQLYVCGAPSTPQACQFTCDDDENCPDGNCCPPGYGCGADDTCRRPSGEFTAAAEVGDGVTFDLFPVDIGGDGRASIMRVSPSAAVEIYSFGDAGVVDAAVEVPGRTRAPAAGDITGDGNIDMAIALEGGAGAGGINFFAGSASGEFSPLAFSLYEGDLVPDFVALMNVYENGAVDEEVLFAGGGLVVPLNPTLEAQASILDLPFDAIEDVAIAPLDTRTASPCDEIVIAKKGAEEVDVITPCRFVAGVGFVANVAAGPQLTLPSVALPDGKTVAPSPSEVSFPRPSPDNGVSLQDLNGDGHVDMTVAVVDGNGNPSLAVAFGFGDGTFANIPDSVLGVPNTTLSVDKISLFEDPEEDRCDDEIEVFFPLASGDVTGDGFAELVLADGVYRTLAVPGGFRLKPVFCPNSGEPWREAVVADFTGDGQLDVVASDQSDTLFFGAGSPGGLSPDLIVTSFAAQNLTVGDFDANGLADVAYTLRLPGPGPDNPLEVAVSYGVPFAPPTDAASFGDLGAVRFLASGRVEGGDANDDLLVVAEDSGALLLGTSDQGLAAPYFFIKGIGGVTFAAYEVAVADFRGDGRPFAAVFLEQVTNEIGELIVFDEESPYGVASLELPSGESSSPTVTYGELSNSDGWRDARIVTLDTTGDGLPEVVALGERRLSIYGYNGSSFEPLSSESFDESQFEWDPRAALLTGDVDGDGLTDLLVRTSGGSLFIFWNNNGFSFGSVTVVEGSGPDEEEEGDQGLRGRVLGVAVADINGDGVVELVAATQFGTYALPAGSRELGEEVLVEGVTGGTALAAGDVNGDGIVDLLVGNDSGFRVYLAEPADPGEAPEPLGSD